MGSRSNSTPPSEVFDVRLVDDNVPVSGFGEGLLKDIRLGGAQFEGTTQHQIRFQAASGTDLTIAWDLPEGVTGTIQSIPDGGAYGKDMTGRDSLMVDAGAPDAIVTLEYAPNQAPTLDTNTGVTLLEGGSTPLTTSDLSASDLDDAPSALTYRVTDGPTQGTLVVDGSPNASFTQVDLDGGLVEYEHTAPNATNDSLSLFVEDAGGKRTSEATFPIVVTSANAPRLSPSIRPTPQSRKTTAPPPGSPPFRSPTMASARTSAPSAGPTQAHSPSPTRMGSCSPSRPTLRPRAATPSPSR